ncbi:MAG: redoxin family protein [Clostridiales bacterium]|nr:redoxin family protein [Clostridiales bacterium]
MEEKEKQLNTVETPDENETPVATESVAAEAAAAVDPAQETTAAVDAAETQAAVSSETQEQAENASEQPLPPKKEKGLRAWWARHKPTKRRLIQIYSLLLYNAYMRGFIKGEIFTGITKNACVPGLNCYSCPGAVAACPLGALQNALTGTGHGGLYYALGILLLYGLIFGRTICGFLCPAGLGQELMYKIKTPKLQKNKVTRILSYFKYVLLAVLVIGIPVIYAIDQTAVPGFCKYICPVGTFEGAFMLLVNPSNDSLYAMLGGLFSWKTVVLVCVLVGSIFIYRFFCRFLCPLGAIYGLFNKFALLGIKVDNSKCTHCDKCVKHCKMDVKKVGDHECINCGECIGVCPTKAIRWKGSKIFMKNVDDELVTAPAMDAPAVGASPTLSLAQASASFSSGGGNEAPAERTSVAPVKKRDRAFWVKVIAIALAAVLFFGVFTYVNFFAVADDTPSAEYLIAIKAEDDSVGLLSFRIGSGDKYSSMSGKGSGTKDDPFVVKSISGRWDVPTAGKDYTYYKFKTSTAKKYTIYSETPNKLDIKISYVLAGKEYSLYDYQVDGDTFELSLKQPDGFGNTVGSVCYDFTLNCYNGRDPVTLSEFFNNEETGAVGKVVVVNFWGTWCGPCVAELPEFEEVREKYSDRVEMIAIHSKYGSGGSIVPNFLNSKGWNEWGIIFAQDTGTVEKSDVFAMLGGRGNVYPRTVVINADGIITATFDGRVAGQTLENAVLAAMASANEE